MIFHMNTELLKNHTLPLFRRSINYQDHIYLEKLFYNFSIVDGHYMTNEKAIIANAIGTYTIDNLKIR